MFEAPSIYPNMRSFANMSAKSLTRRKTEEHVTIGAIKLGFINKDCTFNFATGEGIAHITTTREVNTLCVVCGLILSCIYHFFSTFCCCLLCILFPFYSYAKEERMQYILPLGDSTASVAIDATLMGNVARFLNHSCAPNIYKVACATTFQNIYRPRKKQHELLSPFVFSRNLCLYGPLSHFFWVFVFIVYCFR